MMVFLIIIFSQELTTTKAVTVTRIDTRLSMTTILYAKEAGAIVDKLFNVNSRS